MSDYETFVLLPVYKKFVQEYSEFLIVYTENLYTGAFRLVVSQAILV